MKYDLRGDEERNYKGKVVVTEKEERRAKVADCRLMLQPKFNRRNGMLRHA